jgi:two-component system phosphate regulon response regulator PhoB
LALRRRRCALSRGRASDPIRTVRGTGYFFDERFGKDERLSKSA